MNMIARTGDARPHAIVIGSGFGGLAAAIRLGARGYRVTVLERLDAPGGRAYVHRQDGFTFDAGPTIVTAPFLLEELERARTTGDLGLKVREIDLDDLLGDGDDLAPDEIEEDEPEDAEA